MVVQVCKPSIVDREILHFLASRTNFPMSFMLPELEHYPLVIQHSHGKWPIYRLFAY